jgi:predicted nucleic-acid-binding protein
VTGIDTNVLIRLFVRDDPNQLKLARKFFKSLTPDEPGWISLANLLEIEWVLRSTYKHDRAGFARILDDLLALNTVVIEQPETVTRALVSFRAGKAGFADCLIAASAGAAGCKRVVTFDTVAARDAGMELLRS